MSGWAQELVGGAKATLLAGCQVQRVGGWWMARWGHVAKDSVHCCMLHQIESHRIASHRIAAHRIAAHRIAAHRCADLPAVDVRLEIGAPLIVLPTLQLRSFVGLVECSLGVGCFVDAAASSFVGSVYCSFELRWFG